MIDEKEEKVYCQGVIDFYKKNGAYPAYFDEDDKGNKIGIWYSKKSQRVKIGSMDDEEVVLLKAMNIDFGYKLLLWNEWFELLDNYFSESGSEYINSEYTLDDGLKLGKWAKRQLNNIKNLSEEQCAKLGKLNWKAYKEKSEPKQIGRPRSKDYHERQEIGRQRAIDREIREQRKREEEANKNRIEVERKERLKQEIQEEYERDTDMKKDIKLDIFKSEKSTFSGGTKGSIIYASIENETDKCIDIEVLEFALIQGKRNKKHDFYLNGYFNTRTSLLPHSCRTTARMYYYWNLKKEGITNGDRVELVVKDVISNIVYASSFEYFEDNDEWVCTMRKSTTSESSDDYVEKKLKKYMQWLQEGLITDTDYQKVKSKLLEQLLEGGGYYE